MIQRSFNCHKIMILAIHVASEIHLVQHIENNRLEKIRSEPLTSSFRKGEQLDNLRKSLFEAQFEDRGYLFHPNQGGERK